MSPLSEDHPLLVASAAVTTDPIFLRAVSSWYNKDVDGTPATISAPATTQINDTLICLKAGFGQALAAPAGWTALPAYVGGNLQLYSRLADGTAADDFAIAEITTRNVVGQIAVFGNTLSEITELVVYQGGTINARSTGADTDFDLLGIPIDAAPEVNDLMLAVYMREKNAANAGVLSIVPSSVPVTNTVDSMVYRQAVAPVSDLWVGWNWEYENNSSPAIPASIITYLPLTTFCVEVTQIQRLRF